jgi:hypothetical protein
VLWHQRGRDHAGRSLDTPVLGLYQVRDGRLARAQMFYSRQPNSWRHPARCHSTPAGIDTCPQPRPDTERPSGTAWSVRTAKCMRPSARPAVDQVNCGGRASSGRGLLACSDPAGS